MADIIFPGETPEEELGISWLPKNVNLKIWQGDKQEFFVDFENSEGAPIVLTGNTVQAVIKATPDSVNTYNFSCTIGTGINENRVRVYMSSAVSETIPAGDYVWNLQLTDGTGDVRTYLAGDVEVMAQVD